MIYIIFFIFGKVFMWPKREVPARSEWLSRGIQVYKPCCMQNCHRTNMPATSLAPQPKRALPKFISACCSIVPCLSAGKSPFSLKWSLKSALSDKHPSALVSFGVESFAQIALIALLCMSSIEVLSSLSFHLASHLVCLSVCHRFSAGAQLVNNG